MLDIYSRNILENIHDAFLAIDKNWHITYVNSRTEQLLQKEKIELLGADLQDIFPQQLNTTLHILHNEMLETHDVIHFDTYFVQQQKWFELHAYPLKDKLFIYLNDITARKEAEKSLRINEQLKQSILDSLDAHIAVLDKNGTIIAVNEGWERYAKNNDCHPEDHYSSVGVNYLDACCKGVIGEFTTFAQQALRGILSILQGDATHFSMEYPCPSPDAPHWYLMNVTSIPLVQGAVVSHTDITERRLAEEALQTSAMQAQRLLDSSIIGTVIADDNYIFQANNTFLQLLGLTQEELAEHPICWTTITPADYAEIDHKKLQELITHGTWSPFEKEFIRQDGSRVAVEIGAVKLQDDPLQWIGFVLDISERKAQEQRKDDFISIASHELRTPITTLGGLTQLLKRRLNQPENSKLVAYLSQMEQQTTRMTRLIDDLLDVSKIQSGRVDYLDEPIEIDKFIYEIIDTLQQTSIKHKLIVHGEVSGQIVGDEERLRRVLINLISNAIKYSPQAERVDIRVNTTGQMVVISVQDYGAGIPASEQTRIFDRFYRGSSPYEKAISGLGMGLYISHEIVEHYGGKITVESVEDLGSRFSVYLPLNNVALCR